MGQLGRVYENNVLDAILGPGFVPPPTVYVALFNQSPTSVAPGIECIGGSYARVPVANNAVSWPLASNSQKSNGIPIMFPTATGGWGTVIGFGIFDSLVGGIIICYGDLQYPKQVILGAIPQFGIGLLTITAA